MCFSRLQYLPDISIDPARLEVRCDAWLASMISEPYRKLSSTQTTPAARLRQADGPRSQRSVDAGGTNRIADDVHVGGQAVHRRRRRTGDLSWRAASVPAAGGSGANPWL